jgi:hypothetical protein
MNQIYLLWRTGNLPKYSGLYQVTVSNGLVRKVMTLFFHSDSKKWSMKDRSIFPGVVLAWSPQVEPYMGEETL